jgi:hypothetical protein
VRLFFGNYVPSTSIDLFRVALNVTADDDKVLDELRLVLGDGQPGADLPAKSLSVDIAGARVRIRGDDLPDPRSFLLGFGSATIPMRPVAGRDDALALGDSDAALITFEGDSTTFTGIERWRRVLANYLLLRVLRLRPEYLFFHAASVVIGGSGVMFVGPKGSGKSTLALSLASRGHGFLGDEMAVYSPVEGQLLPFQRPVGIKPGPRSARIETALRKTHSTSDEEGMVRVPIRDILDAPPARPAPLERVVFLQGFGARPLLQQVTAGRDELAHMQPIATSLQEGTKASRVFEMIRLLSRCGCFHLTAGAPDETAAFLEQRFSAVDASG